MSKYFNNERQAYIAELLHVVGFVKRAHLMKKYFISEVQAGKDLGLFKRNNPDAMVYDAARKKHVAKNGKRKRV